ncbi:MAG: sulfotransferase [Planctomycetota bacterium]
MSDNQAMERGNGRKRRLSGVLSRRVEQPHAERATKNPIPWYTPRFWHGMQLGVLARQFARHGFRVSPSKWHTAASITATSMVNSAAALADAAIYGGSVRRTELEHPPLFILGHWRSGTTFLHELLIRDPRHTFATTYQCYAASHFVLSEAWVTPWTGFLLPSRRPMDNMAAGWQRPQEDEMALANLGVPSPYLSMMFPNDGPVFEEYLDLAGLSDEELQRWKTSVERFIRRLTYRDSRRIVLKSPPHTARVRVLREMFPDARFLHISRDPYELFASTCNLWKSLNETQTLQNGVDESWIEEYVYGTLTRMYEAYGRDTAGMAADRLMEVRYEDLVDDPWRVVEQAYGQLDLGDPAEAEPGVRAYLGEVQSYRRNRHELDEATRASVRERWSGYFERYGYE